MPQLSARATVFPNRMSGLHRLVRVGTCWRPVVLDTR
jgi:hypothetical protein